MIPRANNAIFRENPSYPEILEYSTSFLDPNRPSDEQGHIHLSPIDSGSPLWKECSNGNAELVAIHNGHIENKAFSLGQYKSDDEYLASIGYTLQCVNYVTKMTKDIVQWMKDKDKEYSKSDVNA